MNNNSLVGQKKMLELSALIGRVADQIYDRQDNDSCPGCNFYPHDATAEEILAAGESDPSLLNINTLVKRDRAGKLFSVPYVEEYRQELAQINGALRQMAALTTNTGYRDYLLAKAKYFETGTDGDRERADRLWCAYGWVPIEQILIDEEVYDDRLLGKKGAIEAKAVVMDTSLMEKVRPITASIDLFLTEFPISDVGISHTSPQILIGDFENVSLREKMGRVRGQHLPNITRIPGKIMLNNREIVTQSREVFVPLIDRLLPAESTRHREIDAADAYLATIVGHEISHAYAGNYQDEPKSIERSVLEETKATMLSYYNLALAAARGVITQGLAAKAKYLILAEILMDYRLGQKNRWRESYSRSACIMWNMFVSAGIIIPQGQRFSLCGDDFMLRIKKVAAELLEVKRTGNNQKYKDFIEDHQDPTTVQYLVGRYAADLPI